MIEKILFMAVTGGNFYRGGVMGDFFQQLEDFGVFEYMLPFLIIFALIYGVLSSMKMFKENPGVNGVIAFAVGLMALQVDFVPRFFSEVFPRFGIGLTIILLLLILTGFFIPYEQTWISWVYFGIGAVILIIVLISASGSLYWSGADWWYNNWGLVAAVVVMLIALAIIVGGSKEGSSSHKSALTDFIKKISE